MSKNYFVETSGDYQLHVEQWCDGGMWITKNGKHLDTNELFDELKSLQEQLKATKQEDE